MKNINGIHDFPQWLRFRAPSKGNGREVELLISTLKIDTVCKSALCPNRPVCWSRKIATFLLLGDTCTRNCKFCAVKKGIPLTPDPLEKEKILHALEILRLKYVVLTMVTRDDLPDGGAFHISEIVKHIRNKIPEIKIEVLVSDFGGNEESLKTILDSGPDVFSHNIETVERLCGVVRDRRCSYTTSLKVLETVNKLSPDTIIKSGLMLGLGEMEIEVLKTLRDLKNSGCKIVTIGQYLQPTKNNYPVKEFIQPDKFRFYSDWAKEKLGLAVIAGPEVRSSYKADFWYSES
ncbi:MAG: lipoyl synthase [Candidatus Hydrogenedentes bacterium]|nr:lipoyl synthase [Candidatus Hydrogenedentota bacterium]